MDSISTEEDIQHIQSIQHVISLGAATQSIKDIPRDISSWSGDPESASQSVFSSTDTLTMFSAAPASPIDKDKPHHGKLRLRSAFGATNFSNASVRSIASHLFTGSRQIPAVYTISDLCTYIERTPTAHINLSKWCRDRTGIPHEFLLLQLEDPQNKKTWLRIERRPLRSSPFARLISSTAPSDDSATLSRSCNLEFHVPPNSDFGDCCVK